MTILGRIFLALFSLAWIAAAGALTALAWNEGQMLDLEIESFTVQAWIDGNTFSKVLFSTVMALVMLIGLVGFVLAFVRTNTTRKGSLRLRQAEGGVVEVPATALEALVVHALGEMEVIESATAHVALRGGTVESELDLTIGPGASISEVTAGANECLTEVLQEMVGVKNVRRPLVRITIDDTLRSNDWTGASVPAEPEPAEPVATTVEQSNSDEDTNDE
jgi:hypothetical protein